MNISAHAFVPLVKLAVEILALSISTHSCSLRNRAFSQHWCRHGPLWSVVVAIVVAAAIFVVRIRALIPLSAIPL